MHQNSIKGLKSLLKQRKLSSVELTRHYLDRIRIHDEHLNSFITITEELALAQAEAADRLLADSRDGPLTGIPLAHKDLFCTQGVKTSCGSRMLDNFVAPYDATVVERARDAGLVMVGKTNMDEFAMGSSNENSYYGPVQNPWAPGYVPGGSSGGSAAAVSARLTPVATGTDTGGSVRQPAALCGVTGLKPTYGRVSRFGIVAFASSLEQAGLFAPCAEDIAHVLPVIAGFDERDSTSADHPVADSVAALEDATPLRLGVPDEYFEDGLDPAVTRVVEQAIAEFGNSGCKIKRISLPNTRLAVPTYYVVAPAEASSNLSRFDGVRFGHRSEQSSDLESLYKNSRAEGFGAEVKRRIMIGTYALSSGYYDAYYLKAQKLRRLISEDFQKAFEHVDLIVGPTTPTPAFPIGEKTDDPVTMYLSDIFTTAVNLAGLPAISLPAGFADGLPVGCQLIGNYFTETSLLRCAHQYQQITDWHSQVPEGFQ